MYPCEDMVNFTRACERREGRIGKQEGNGRTWITTYPKLLYYWGGDNAVVMLKCAFLMVYDTIRGTVQCNKLKMEYVTHKSLKSMGLG